MKVTYNWLKEFVGITLAPDVLADRLTMAGLEVESCEKKSGDTIFTIEVTSNRPDWLSVCGIAREIAAITGKKLKIPLQTGKAPDARGGVGTRLCVASGRENVEIRIENKKDCPLYTAKIIRGVRCGASPEWLRTRLELVGVRPVNNIVDITNYVLLERGEPLHAFDLDKLVLPISIRRARQGEKLVAIDGKEYVLDSGVLVIADSRRAIAIAGVMGGKDTEVTSTTKNILLEAALFDSVLVRRGRQKLGLQSESSYRFERGIDPAAPDYASLRARGLIKELAGGSLDAQSRCGVSAEKKKIVPLDIAKTAALLDAPITVSIATRILSALGFTVTTKGKTKCAVTVPSFRRDVTAAIDLVEEIARIYGYARIPSRLPSMIMQQREKPSLIPAVKEMLRAQGLDEVLTFSLVDKTCARDFYQAADTVEIVNPLSSEQEILRPVLMPSLCRCVAYNLNQRQQNSAIFEIAKTYTSPDKERNVLGIALAGEFSRWYGTRTGNVRYEAGFLGLKGMIENLVMRLAIDPGECRYEYSGAFSVSVYVKGKEMGALKQLNAKELAAFDIKDKNVFLAEIALDPLLAMAGKKAFAPFTRVPSISRDITIEVGADISVEKILAVARAEGKGLMSSVAFRDYYDKNLPAGVKRITVTCTYSAGDRTLTETEISPVHTGVVERLKTVL